MDSFKSSEADPNLMETQRAILKSLSIFKDRKDLNNNQKEQNNNKVEAIEWNQHNKENIENSLEKTVEKAMENIGVKMEVKLEKMILKLVKTENEALEDRIKRHIDTRLGQLKSKLEISIGGELGNLKSGVENCVETGYSKLISNMNVKHQTESENKFKLQGNESWKSEKPKSMAASYNKFSNSFAEQKSDTPKTTNTFFSTKTNETDLNVEQNMDVNVENANKELGNRYSDKSIDPSPEQVKNIVQNMVKELSLNKVKNCDKMGDASESEKSEKTNKSSTEFGLDSESSVSRENGSEKSVGKSEVVSGLTTSSSESESSGSDSSDLSVDEKNKTFLSGLKCEKPELVDSKVKAFVEKELKMKIQLKAESNAYSDFKSISSSSSTRSSEISKSGGMPAPRKQETVNKINDNEFKNLEKNAPKAESKVDAQNQGWQTIHGSDRTESAVSEKISIPKITDWRCASNQNSDFDGKLMVKFKKVDIEDMRVCRKIIITV